MSHVSLREHEWCPIQEEGPVTDARAAMLEALARHWPAGAIEWRRRSFKFAGFCGVVRVDGLIIEVLPKISATEVPVATARSILINMLRVTGTLAPEVAGGAHLALEKHHLLDVFIQVFCRQVSREMVQGVIRTYQDRDGNLTAIRGRLDFVQQMRHNLVHQEKVACRYEELSSDNAWNQVLKAVLNKLSRLAVSLDTRRAVSELLTRMGDISLVTVSRQDASALTFNRSNLRWAPTFRQCEWLLAGMSPTVAAGASESVSLLFDMDRLFEGYIARCLKRLLLPLGYTVQTQGPRWYLAEDSKGKAAFQLRPDIAVRDAEGTLILIADTKWKQPGANVTKGISSADAYQMTVYAQRYRVPSACLIYPRMGGSHQAIERYQLTQADASISAVLWALKEEAGTVSIHELLEFAGATQK